MKLTSEEAFNISLGSEKYKSRLDAALETAYGRILESAKEGKLFVQIRLSDLIPGFNHVNPYPEHSVLKNLVLASLKAGGFDFEYPCLQDNFFVSWRKG